MRLSVIIPCYNAEDTLASQLEALSNQSWDEPWEVLVVDNGSTDRSREIAHKYQNKFDHYQVIDASEKQGASHARNVGVTFARAEAVVFCDADDVVAEGWVAAIGRAFEKYEFVASRFDFDKLNTNTGQDYISGNQTAGLQQLWYPPYAYHTGGCGMGVTKRIHQQVQGFDEDLLRLQDTDYCLRIQQLGVKLQFVSDALIYIRNRPSTKGAYFQGRTWAKYNTLLYKKYRGDQKIPNLWKQYWKDWYRVLRQGIRQRETPRWAFRFGWQIGLLQGIVAYRSAPAVVTNYKPHLIQRKQAEVTTQ